MMQENEKLFKELVGEFEVHDANQIRRYFERGIDPNGSYKGRKLIDVFITMYLRSPRFSDCIQVFLDYGLKYEDDLLYALLLDNDNQLKQILKDDPEKLHQKYSIEGSAYIPLYDVGLMHICAEYNLVKCANILLDAGIDIDDRAGVNDKGFGGQSPIFHTVNSNLNHCVEMFYFLLHNEADLNIQVKGIEWGLGHDWETLIPDVTPVSYCMMGLLPQMHRNEKDIYEMVSAMLKKKYGIAYVHRNSPNKYLKTF